MLTILLALLTIPFFHGKVNSDALLGTWKMDAAKSEYKNAAKPKSLTLRAHLEEEDVVIQMVGTDATGAPFDVTTKQPAKGGAMEFLTDTLGTSKHFDTAGYLVAKANKMEMNFMRGTMLFAIRTIEISKDGTSAKMTYKTKPSGKDAVSTVVFLQKGASDTTK